jgi:SpoVK/Ycf46/Vps4 family AAA+-type ATPase
MMAPGGRFGANGIRVEIAVLEDEYGARLSRNLFQRLEVLVSKGQTYRGRVISLEGQALALGGGNAVKVHRLARIDRDSVILPRKTLEVFEHNVVDFIAARQQLKSLQFQTRKGVLFHGPPGTGKTFTIHYLASQLQDHTTLLVTAEQTGLLAEYFRLARFLQPSIVVIEDVDIIARHREQMPGKESLLNQLLNEMDGLQEDAEILFILTTNHPEQLEPALACRPGRIDQAIEFPLPDEECRAKLIRLYGRGLEVSEEIIASMVSRTKGVSAAFIKELMRRCAQFQFESSKSLAEPSPGSALTPAAVNAALEEILITGGVLTRQLLGGERTLGFR